MMESGLRMTCRVNKKIEIDLYQDEPLIISVSIVNSGSIQSSSYNIEINKKLDEIELKHKTGKIDTEYYNTIKNKLSSELLAVKTFSFGGPDGWPKFIKIFTGKADKWDEINWDVHVLNKKPIDEVAIIDNSRICYIEYGVDPNSIIINEGLIDLKTQIEIAKETNIQSNICKINFLKKPTPMKLKEQESKLLEFGRYFYYRRILDRAQEYADKILSLYPTSINGLILSGDIEELKGNLKKALEYYENAFEEFDKQIKPVDESPDLIMVKITHINNLLIREKKI